MTFEYYYRKSALGFQLFFGFFFIGAVFFGFFRMASLSGFTRMGPMARTPHISPFGLLFFIVPLMLMLAGLKIFVPSLLKLVVRKPVISGDGHGMQVLGKWSKSYYFQWQEIDYVRYEQRIRRTNFHEGNGPTYNQSQWLIVKPKDGQAVEVEIGQLTGTIDDITSDIRKLAPQIPIMGL
ncbi:hypothetical protein [Streptococcus moroccensis]|uniref:PH domain-containing protein n=1 Tax=Streptococcus moroccensis TaxID=1451356 RepID=A0ABT9YNS3_9STRE|nr:hypothetical protein [Streptococcus moroccensis]MDQ0221633.1 hypothetical protein [Streptococcus moroccensis]